MSGDDLARFVAAQESAISDVLAELTAGAKRSHWMWFVFPQLAGLGRSAMAERYALPSLEAAGAYLAHPVLGPRITRCTGLVLSHPGRSVRQMFGSPDDLKFHSSMTLFSLAAGAASPFAAALDRHFGARPDERTLSLLAALPGPIRP